MDGQDKSQRGKNGERFIHPNGRIKIEEQRWRVSGGKADGTALSGWLPAGEDK